MRGNREQMYGYFPAFGKLSESEGGSTHSDDTKEAGGKFDDCGLFRLLYMVKDKEILKEMETECLAALEEYDRRYHAGYVETLQSYLKHNGSIQAVAAELYTHRNTVLYRIGKYQENSGK